MTTQEANGTAITATTPIEQLEQGLQAAEDAMHAVVSSDVKVLRDASHHILSAGGKRIRPRLLMLAFLAAGGTDVKRAAAPAAAVELMHTASVVHDDINDHGVMRRGRPSINARWGRTFALLTGDFLFTAVYKLMAPYGELNVDLANAATALVEGETLQAAAVKENNFTRDVYGRIIALKTAALFKAAGVMGGKLAKADEKSIHALGQFAYNVGLAFQIVDDILDIVGDETVLGKTAGIDLAQGRGFGAINDGQGQDDPDEDVSTKVKRKLLEGNRLQEAQDQARQLVALAQAHLAPLPNSEAKSALIDLAQAVIDRNR